MSAPSPAESTPLNHQSTTNCSAVSNGGGIFSKYPVAPNMFTSASSMMAASNGNPFGISFINGLGGGFGSRNSTSSPPKSKRCRQRVDAGEPRHFYQQQQQQQQTPPPPKLQKICDESAAELFASTMPEQQHQKLECDPQQAMSPSMANAILEALSRLQNEQPSQNGAHAAMTDSFNNSVAEFEQGTAVDGGELLELAAEDDEYVGDESEVDETVDGVGGDVFRQQPTEHNVGQQQSTNNMEAGKDWQSLMNIEEAKTTNNASVADGSNSGAPNNTPAIATANGLSVASSRRKSFFPTKRNYDECGASGGDGDEARREEEAAAATISNSDPDTFEGSAIDVTTLMNNADNILKMPSMEINVETATPADDEEADVKPPLITENNGSASTKTTSSSSSSSSLMNAEVAECDRKVVNSGTDDGDENGTSTEAGEAFMPPNFDGGSTTAAANSLLFKWQQDCFDQIMQQPKRFYPQLPSNGLFAMQQSAPAPPISFLPAFTSSHSSAFSQKPELFGLNERNQAAVAQLQKSQQLEIQQNYALLAQALKDELFNHLKGVVDKVVGDFANNDQQANAARLLAAMSLAIKQQQQQLEQQFAFSSRMYPSMAAATMVPSTSVPSSSSCQSLLTSSKSVGDLGQRTAASLFANCQNNPLMAAAAASVAAGMRQQEQHQSRASNGIFPNPFTAGTCGDRLSAAMPKPPFIVNSTASSAISPSSVPPMITRSSFNNSQQNDDHLAPKKKRSKVTDTVRGPRSSLQQHHHRDNNSSYSLPASERSSPQVSASAYFPPTMVQQPSQLHQFNHHHHNHPAMLRPGGDSPRNSDEQSDYGGNEVSDKLTNIHLRKAKLMFFYTRYPNSQTLRSYFPDVNFDKSLTAQLVKWFSNFREFFYMQMEKYAKQALAEGVIESEEIQVVADSEIYRVLNQHYNKNNSIPTPPKLIAVIEKTLRKFFESIKQGKDADPSWKKAIYKEIQPLDDPIPEFFKRPQFMEQLQLSN